MPVLSHRLTVVAGGVLGDEVRVAVLLHQRRDAVEREVPGDLLEFAAAGRPVFRRLQPGRRVDDIEQRRAFWAERAAIDRMVRIAFDMDDVGAGVLGTVAHAVNENAAGDGAIGAGVAGLGRRRQLEWPNRGCECFTGITKSQSAQAGRGQSRPREFYETSTSQVHHRTPAKPWRGTGDSNQFRPIIVRRLTP